MRSRSTGLGHHERPLQLASSLGTLKGMYSAECSDEFVPIVWPTQMTGPVRQPRLRARPYRPAPRTESRAPRRSAVWTSARAEVRAGSTLRSAGVPDRQLWNHARGGCRSGCWLCSARPSALRAESTVSECMTILLRRTVFRLCLFEIADKCHCASQWSPFSIP